MREERREYLLPNRSRERPSLAASGRGVGFGEVHSGALGRPAKSDKSEWNREHLPAS